MPVFVRPRGARWELRVRHRLLPRPFHATFGAEPEARAYGDQLDAMLDRGIVPQELLAPAERVAAADPLVAEILRGYLAGAPHLTASDEALLPSLLDDITGLRLSGVTYRWATEWVRRMKMGERQAGASSRSLKPGGLAPGTIRKRVGALARVIDWHLATHAQAGQVMASNALRTLPAGYSQASPVEQREMRERGLQMRHDLQRDVRMPAGGPEESRVLAALAGERRPDRERPWGPDPDFALLLDLILHTGLRLREAYTLRVDQVDTRRHVLLVAGTKGARGRAKPRTVPLVPHLRPLLAARCAGRVGLLWPYWSGDPDDLARCTGRLSQRFRTLFDFAGVPQMTEHDLRHEATCRWLELRDDRGRWVYSEVEIARIMGWSSLQMMLRYASLRGEDLAARLG